MTCINTKQQGVALIQVLMLVAILSVLLLLMAANTQQQQRQVIAIQEQYTERLALYSQGNDLLFALLTEPTQPIMEGTATGIAQLTSYTWNHHWNFYAQPFSLNNIYGNLGVHSQARITNLNSLVSLQFAGQALESLMRSLGYNNAEAERLAKAVQNWQRETETVGVQLYSERSESIGSIAIQHGYELAFVPGWNKKLAQQAAPYITTFATGSWNEAYLPDNMLEIILSTPQADTIRQLRAEGRFNTGQFSTITGIEEDEFRAFFAGPDYRLEVWHEHNPALVRVLEVHVSPYKKEPLEMRYQGWGY